MMRNTLLLLVSLVLDACGLAEGQQLAPAANALRGREVGGYGQLTEYVRRIFQDSRGHYWFGSNGEGVYRYDGKSLEVFAEEEGLAGYQVTGILEDRTGQIWISTNGGVSQFDGRTFTNYTTKEGLPSDGCWSIFEARDGTIWVGTGAGLCRSRPGARSGEGLSFEPVALPTSGTTDAVGYWISGIAQDRTGDLWFATRDAGVFRYDGRVFQWLTTKDGLGDNESAGILVDSKDQLWFGSMNGGLTFYDRRSMQHFSSPDDIGNNEVWTVMEDRQGHIWFSSEGYGVYRYEGGSLRNYSAEQGLGVRAVQSIHQDREGELWFGGGGGLYRLEGDSMVHVKREDLCCDRYR